MDAKPMRPRHRIFLELLAADPLHNTGKAYTAAGYKATGESARVNATKLLQKPTIKHEYERMIAERGDRLSEKLDLAVEWFLRRWLKNAKDARAVGQFSAANKSYELMAKMLGRFAPDKVEHSGVVGLVPITSIEAVKPTELPRGE